MVETRFRELLDQAFSDLKSEEIESLLTQAAMSTSKDTFSEIFEAVMSHSERKKYGQFFTHRQLVDHIIANLPITSTSTVLDPSCGAGAFLSAVSANLDGLGNEGGSIKTYGVDISAKALAMCRINLAMQAGGGVIQSQEKMRDADFFTNNFSHTNFITEFEINDFPEVAAEDGFDIVLGNPPFMNLKKGADFEPDHPLFSPVISGVVNSCTLFIAKSLSLLKNGGWLGMVLPKNILRVKSFSALRGHLVKHCTIAQIFDIGHYFRDVRGDQIILILQKCPPTSASKPVEISVIHSGNEFVSPYRYTLPQEIFTSNKFPIYYDEEIHQLAQKLEQIPTNLADYSSDIFRGLPLGANHKLVLPCPTTTSMRLLRGDSLNRFAIGYELGLDSSASLEISEKKFTRQNHERIVLQNIVSREGGLAACVAPADCYCLDTVTNVVLDDASLNRYMVGLLNSRVANFYILMVTFLHSNFTMHADRSYIGQIPIAKPSPSQRRAVEFCTERLAHLPRGSEEYWREYDSLNHHLYQIYRLSEEEIALIERSLSSIMSVKSNG